ncbi:MAG: ribosome small subunit-dependent GTPase A [Bdellovibrionales bacterium GWB1_55_8]|nr:MAG: ribosome small subunit-dependent GTPase A [Bdellovibrionales bacterium GWB1_55_8]
MSPKFRGDAEDWLDQEEGSGPRLRKQGGGRGGSISPERANATVAEVFPKQCTVVLDRDGSEAACAYRRATVLAWEDVRERSPVAVGDRVLVESLKNEPGAAVMQGVATRKNALERPAPGRDRSQEGRSIKHVIAANVDVLVIVASVREPEFPDGLVDRYLIAAQKAKIEPLICVTKMDLLRGASSTVSSPSDNESQPWFKYRQLGFAVRTVCSKNGVGIDELRTELAERRAVFAGQSGVGKTSLLTALIGHAVGKTTEVNPMTGKGRHTTTSAVLLRPAGWIDTPGVREFGLLGVTSEELAGYYPEFAELSCARFSCMHLDEPECAARSLPRYASYRRILESLLAGDY